MANQNFYYASVIFQKKDETAYKLEEFAKLLHEMVTLFGKYAVTVDLENFNPYEFKIQLGDQDDHSFPYFSSAIEITSKGYAGSYFDPPEAPDYEGHYESTNDMLRENIDLSTWSIFVEEEEFDSIDTVEEKVYQEISEEDDYDLDKAYEEYKDSMLFDY